MGNHWRIFSWGLTYSDIDVKISGYCMWKVREEEGKNKYSLKMTVQFSHSVVSNSLRPHELQHAWPPCPSPTPGDHPNSCPLSRWYHPTISSSVVPFSSCLQSSIFPSIRVFSNESALRIRWPKYWSFSFNIILPMNTQDWSPLEWTGWTSLLPKGLSRVFSNTTVQKHQFFGAQVSL